MPMLFFSYFQSQAKDMPNWYNLVTQYWPSIAGFISVTAGLLAIPRTIRGVKKAAEIFTQIKRGLDVAETFVAVAEKLTPDTIDRLVKMAEQFRPNGGDSMFDRLTRIEMQLLGLQSRLNVNDASRRASMNASGLAYWESDAKGACVFATKKLADIIGVAPEDAHGDGWATNLHPEDSEEVYNAWRRAVEQQRAFTKTYRFVVGEETRTVQAQTKPIIVGEDVVGYTGILTPIND